MAQDAEFQKQIQRIGELVEQLELAADPNARALAKEFLESLMAMHGAALERILEFAAGSGEPGETIIRKCADDELVRRSPNHNHSSHLIPQVRSLFPLMRTERSDCASM
jgi:hypothetical protein